MTVDSLAAKYTFHASVSAAFVARELAPAGLRSGPDQVIVVYQKDLGYRFWGCYAAQREQATGLVFGIPAPWRERAV
ncbi:hypothetical protein C1886_05085 [Pseudomonas sp. FW300-N1A1]|uniref:hypothetical protein n=1 Tax=Pseudomonas sp. FW300-N1A1 TaxID=2075555 RepID=UPI000CD112F6|nr:hypothetical protein [Pseudomonas sp. FW300-N1A1]POA21646.1 hypothetical protein C1886_05085 [Pseudomonas sp. FW300-N1A1]